MSKINKVLLAERVAERTGMNHAQVEAVIKTTAEVIVDFTKAGETVTISGFGQFSAQKRKSREGVNPRTGERMMIHSVTIPKFIAGKNFKDALRELDQEQNAQPPAQPAVSPPPQPAQPAQ